MNDKHEPSHARTGEDCCRPSPVEVDLKAEAARIAKHFDGNVTESITELDLTEPLPISALMLELLKEVDDEDPSVLDIGCGPGGQAVRLLEAGARSVTGIDVSPTSIDMARRRAENIGIGAERARFVVGDAASVSLQPHDWVLLERVICCYGDAGRLVTNALTATQRLLAFSVPESRGWRGFLNTIGWTVENMWKTIFIQDHCRGYVHDLTAVEHQLEAAGLHKRRSGHRGLWYAAVFERETSADDVAARDNSA